MSVTQERTLRGGLGSFAERPCLIPPGVYGAFGGMQSRWRDVPPPPEPISDEESVWQEAMSRALVRLREEWLALSDAEKALPAMGTSSGRLDIDLGALSLARLLWAGEGRSICRPERLEEVACQLDSAYPGNAVSEAFRSGNPLNLLAPVF